MALAALCRLCGLAIVCENSRSEGKDNPEERERNHEALNTGLDGDGAVRWAPCSSSPGGGRIEALQDHVVEQFCRKRLATTDDTECRGCREKGTARRRGRVDHPKR